MLLPKLLNATETRKNFYQLLKQVSEGGQIYIENTDTGEKFQIVKAIPQPQINIEELLNDFSKVGLKSMSIEEMKDILNSTYDPSK